MSSDDRILGYLEQIVETDSSGALKKAFDNIKCTIDEGRLSYPEGSVDPADFCEELAELLKKRIRKEIADECQEAIQEELDDIPMDPEGEYNPISFKNETLCNILNIIRGDK